MNLTKQVAPYRQARRSFIYRCADVLWDATDPQEIWISDELVGGTRYSLESISDAKGQPSVGWTSNFHQELLHLIRQPALKPSGYIASRLLMEASRQSGSARRVAGLLRDGTSNVKMWW
ncbi:hypothetical protein [Pseudomonas viridiflava]|uniref:hypothetical protein n=1 Tax=Pseudomonas viridiflava TaxID=33069 RepID=UPI001C315D7D|nr:hypothetical protein [Pseudomonas viridiflava]QXG50037.1 hypothetical protein KTT57_13855 [Pseudomonas viridiflava]